MTGAGEDAPAPLESNGGEFLLSLIQKPRQQQTSQQSLPSGSTPITPKTLHQQSLVIDPAVAAVGPSIALPPSPWPANGYDLPSPVVHPPWSHPLAPPFPPGFLGFPQFPGNHLSPNQFPGNQRVLPEDLHKLGFHGNAKYGIHNLAQHKQQEQHKLVFGSLPNNSVQSRDGLLNGSLPENSKFNSVKDLEHEVRSRQLMNSNSSPNSSQHWSFDSGERERRGGVGGGGSGRGGSGRGKLQQSGHYKSTPPPGFSNRQRGGHWEFGTNDNNSRRRGPDRNVGRAKGDMSELSNRSSQADIEEERLRRSSIVDGNDVGLSGQFNHPGLPAGSNLHSVSASDVEDSMLELHFGVPEEADGEGYEREERLRREGEELVDSLLLEGETEGRDEKRQHRNFREKESRVDSRGQRLLSQRLRNLRRHIVCRRDIDSLNAHFLSIYESLMPLEEEKAKQKQLLKLLEKLVREEWPEARLFLYGSCANSFGVSKSDIDVCLAIEDTGTKKSEILLKLADILKSDNLQNVQALTRARVPIVKLMDPVTELSCDICINNILAVVNTKLLRDYAQIDSRLRQLAFIVKHWAKSRGVNETYQGTLSSYASANLLSFHACRVWR
ncbi:UTP:RNA uridylyltransferase 1 isoform X2 [Carica papaya]|uniref:UTP:RNA uridylyltransferase 1 isoform X2 n=1 Tax=Carica papaya TaxID=3649 RepID=UPI000B8CCD82|nr:UTP:RNA uridylyltransferase 1 isoform X2 [Carica papaya]